MAIRALTISALLLAVSAGAAWATDSNFTPANMSGNSATATETKSRPAQPAEPKQPGFWDRESARSGMAANGEAFGKSVRSLWHIPDFFKNQESSYKQRHPNSDK